MAGRSPSAPVAAGRMGHIYPRIILDDAMGSMLGVAQVVTAPTSALAEVLHNALAVELSRCSSVLDEEHVFQYDSVVVSEDKDRINKNSYEVQLLATRAIGNDLFTLLKAFGRFHTTATRHFVQSMIFGLEGLHRAGLACGGLSLSNVFLSEGRVQVAGWFPPVECLQSLLRACGQLFDDNNFVQSTLRQQVASSVDERKARDVRSLAFLIVEMLTGSRVTLGNITRPTEDLLRHLRLSSVEHDFVIELLQPGASIEELKTHPFFLGNTLPTRAPSPNTSTRAGRNGLFTFLLQNELHKCRGLQQNDAQQVRVWVTQFEKKFNRKPHTDEKPVAVQRLERQFRAIHERIEQLERRIQHAGEVESDAEQPRGTEPATGVVIVPDLKIDTALASTGCKEITLDSRLRSPAQNAFMRRASNDFNQIRFISATPNKPTIIELREQGHEIVHQRKEVIGLQESP